MAQHGIVHFLCKNYSCERKKNHSDDTKDEAKEAATEKALQTGDQAQLDASILKILSYRDYSISAF